MSFENNDEVKHELPRLSRKVRIIVAAVLLLAAVVFGVFFSVQETLGVYVSQSPILNNTDTAFVLISVCIGMLAIPGVALFYGGMADSKNVLNTIIASFVTLGVVAFIWVSYGYSIAFGLDTNHLIGAPNWAALQHVGLTPNPSYATTIPHLLFMAFQMIFACLASALIAGAIMGRFKFKSYVMFLILWTTFVYCPLAHWVWGDGGWIKNLGAIDYSGGLVVFAAAGAAALAASLVLGKRCKHTKEQSSAYNLPLAFVGAVLLLFGIVGLNMAASLAAGQAAVSAFVSSIVALSVGTITWALCQWAHKGRPTFLGILAGSITGLVGISASSGFVSPVSAAVTAFIVGIVSYFAVKLQSKFDLDDSFNVAGMFGISGLTGAILTGVFASAFVNNMGANGLIYGTWHLLGVQALSALAIILYSFFATMFVLTLLGKFMELRVSETAEIKGLDITQHGENAYKM